MAQNNACISQWHLYLSWIISNPPNLWLIKTNFFFFFPLFSEISLWIDCRSTNLSWTLRTQAWFDSRLQVRMKSSSPVFIDLGLDVTWGIFFSWWIKDQELKLKHTGTFKVTVHVMAADIPLAKAGPGTKPNISVVSKYTLPILVGDNKKLLHKRLQYIIQYITWKD